MEGNQKLRVKKIVMGFKAKLVKVSLACHKGLHREITRRGASEVTDSFLQVEHLGLGGVTLLNYSK